MTAYRATCPVCHHEFTTYHADPRPWCSVACQYDRPVKGSALRTWLRQERVREHKRWIDDPGLEWVEVQMDERGYIARIQVPRSLREPAADRHIHGRDCAQDWPTCTYP